MTIRCENGDMATGFEAWEAKMVKGWQNPLYPRSDGKGVKGAYEEAALMDDSKAMFGGVNGRRVRGAGGASGAGGAGRAKDAGKTGGVGRKSEKLTKSKLEEWAMANQRAKSYKVYAKKNKEIMQRFRDESKRLRRMWQTREISMWEYRRRKRKLMRETDKANWQSYVDFLEGKFD